MNFPNAALPCHDPIWNCPSTQGETSRMIRVGYLSEQTSKTLPPAVIQPPTTLTFPPWNTFPNQIKFYSQWHLAENVKRFVVENKCQQHDEHTVVEDGCWNIWHFDTRKISAKERWQFSCDWIKGSRQYRQNILNKSDGKYVAKTNLMSLLDCANFANLPIYFIHWKVDDNSPNYLQSEWFDQGNEKNGKGDILNNPDLILRIALDPNPNSDYSKIDVNFFIMNHEQTSMIGKSKLGTICEWIAKMIPICISKYNENAERVVGIGQSTNAVTFGFLVVIHR